MKYYQIKMAIFNFEEVFGKMKRFRNSSVYSAGHHGPKKGRVSAKLVRKQREGDRKRRTLKAVRWDTGCHYKKDVSVKDQDSFLRYSFIFSGRF